MMSNAAFEKALKSIDERLFLGTGPHGYWTIWWRVGERVQASVVLHLTRAPDHAYLDKVRSMDSWRWKKGWLERMDVYNKEVEQKLHAGTEDTIMEITKDAKKIWKEALEV